jgi:hypothetical protein
MTAVLATYATGLAATVAVALAWVAVQRAWRRTFPDRADAPHACAHACARAAAEVSASTSDCRTCPHQEESR